MMHSFTLQTDHFQFFVGDPPACLTADTSDLWKNGSTVASMNGLIGIGTVRYGGSTKVVMTVDEERPQHTSRRLLGDARLEVTSGRVVFWAPESTERSHFVLLDLPSGSYHIAIEGHGLDEVADEMAPTGSEEYWVHFHTTPPSP